MAKPVLSRHRLLRDLRDWLALAWALWWSWAYIHGALAQRFPNVLWWVSR
jgi:hypothetical protein